jgi:GT2 family glycosyltransferase
MDDSAAQNFSVVIATYNRPQELSACVAAVLSSTILPEEIIIVDDGVLEDALVRRITAGAEANQVKVNYRRKDIPRERRGLSESKNIALDLLRTEIFFMLDDDVAVHQDFFAASMAAWQEADPKCIGVGGIIANHRKKNGLEKIYNTIFGLTSRFSWDVTPVGFQVWDEDVEERKIGYYVHGGASSYRTVAARELRFATFLGGRTALEDVDFCLRAKLRGWHFLIEPAATVIHHHTRQGRESEYLRGFKESANRRSIFRRLCPQTMPNKLWFAWSSLGWILRQFLAGHFAKGWGMVKGFGGGK